MARIAGTQILNGDEVYAADQLIDLGPAPPLPGKDDLFTGGGGGPASGSGGGGGGTAFQYPAQRPAGTPFQVWSLTQFYSVDFSKSRIDEKKCVYKKRTIKVCVSCC